MYKTTGKHRTTSAPGTRPQSGRVFWHTTNQAHDGNGNLKDDGTYLYEYNYRSLLCRVKLKSDNSTVATYKHDALGRRVEKEVGSPRERYIYSGFETVSVYDSTNAWVRDFVFGQGIDEPLMLRQADVTDFDGDTDTSEVTRHFYHRNALGSVMLLTDMNEAEGASYRYDPYGAVTITVGGTPQSDDPLGNPFMFTSRFQDEETGLMYYRARHYAPATGRFLQRDPLGYEKEGNLYVYGHGTAANFGFRFYLCARPFGLDSALGRELSRTLAEMGRSTSVEPCRCTSEETVDERDQGPDGAPKAYYSVKYVDDWRIVRGVLPVSEAWVKAGVNVRISVSIVQMRKYQKYRITTVTCTGPAWCSGVTVTERPEGEPETRPVVISRKSVTKQVTTRDIHHNNTPLPWDGIRVVVARHAQNLADSLAGTPAPAVEPDPEPRIEPYGGDVR